jgi:uncharacterized delta-60 repeat protein
MGAREKRVAIRLLVCAIASQVGLECPAFAEAPPSEVLRGEAAVARLRDEGVYDALVATMTRDSYGIHRVDDGRMSNARAEYEALNPARAMQAAFTPSGVRVHSDGDRKWQLGLELKTVGYGQDLQSVTAGAVTAEDDRLEIRKHTVWRRSSDVVEWYVNTPAGLEHGFTLPSPPDRQRVPVGAEDWLRLTLELSGDVRGEVTADHQGVRFQDGQGRHVASYDHLEAWDATGRKLPARMALRGHELSLEVDDRDARYPVIVDPLVWQEVENVSGDLTAGDQAGFSVAISRNTAIVGAFHDNIKKGRVFVFVRESPSESEPSYRWKLEAVLEPPGTKHTAQYGFSVAISGNTAIVGDPLGSFDPNLNPIPSAAYVWSRSGDAWKLEKRIEASDDQYNGRFGASVAISGETAVVGAPAWGNLQNNLFRGKAYVFVSNGGAWTQEAPLEPDDGQREDEFGTSVAVSRDTVIVGAPKHDVVTGAGTNENQGQAYAFVRTNGSWSPPSRLTGSGGTAFDYFGESLGVSGNTAVFGAAGPIDPPRIGLAYVFDRSGSAWNEQQILAADDGQPADTFGGAVAIAGKTIVVGASHADSNGGPVHPQQGAAYTFSRENGTWTQKDKLRASDGEAHDAFGFSVAVGGVGIIVGGPGHDVDGRANQGQAVIFQQPDSDADGLPDEWEKNGVTLEGSFIDLPKMGAKPLHKDIFVHADWMGQDPARPAVLFYPDPRAIQMVIDAFAAAPVTNPDHTDGIAIHIDLGEDSIMKPGEKWGDLSKASDVPFQESTGLVDLGDTPSEETYSWDDVDMLKEQYFIPAHRQGIFHYAVFANALGSGLHRSGLSRGRGRPAADFLVTLGTKTATPGGTTLEQAGTFMHELGHNLGLHHGGGDEINQKPNYLSVMNYSFQFSGLLSPNGQQRQIDYSREKLPSLYETSLDENVGIKDPVKHLTTWNSLTNPNAAMNACAHNPDSYNRLFLPLSQALDWNCDGARSLTPVAEDINGDGICVERGAYVGMLHTTPAGDDEATASAISAGPDRQCNTTAAAGDVQKNKINEDIQPDELPGFNDWPALIFDGGGSIGALGAEEDPTKTPVDEASTEELVDLVQPGLLDEELVAPLDVVTVSAQEGAAPLVVDFDGSASTAVIGTVVDWAWDFGDGATGSGATTQHTYDTPGEYFASLTVTDDGGRVNLVPLLHLVTVIEGPAVTPTPTSTRTATPALTSSRTPTPVPTPTRTATGPAPTGPTPTPLPTTTLATPTPQPTHTAALGIGDVDPSFTATVTSVYGRPVDAVVTQPDHKIIVGGWFASFAGCARRNIARLNPDGSCDASFDPGLGLTVVLQSQGTVRVDLAVKALALQADGKVLVGLLGADGFQNGVYTHSRIIVRLNTDGTIDPSFNAVDVSVGDNSPQSVNAIVVQGDGKILIGGGFLYSNGKIRFGVPYPDGAIARLNSDGSVDSSFVVPDGGSFGGPNNAVVAIALQPNGKVIIGGNFSDVGGAGRYGIARLNGDGSVDAGYNAIIPATGQFASGFGFVTSVAALALLPDGKVLVGGALTNGNPSKNATVARLNADGSRDTGFVDFRKGDLRTLVRQTDGKILIGGNFHVTDPVIRNSIARLDTDGAVDLTFDTPGMTGNLYGGGVDSGIDVSAIALQSDEVVVVGRYDNFNHEPAEGILQLATDGSRDPSFDSNGAGTSLRVFALVRQPDGKLLVGYQPNGINRPSHLNAARLGGIGRLNPNGSTDATFTSPFDANATVFGIVLQPDGKVIVGGSFRLIGSQQTMEFARLNADGTLDAGFVLPGLDRHLGNNTGFALQADGKILVNEVGQFGSRRLTRLDANGNPDETFSVPLSGGAVEHIVVQPDGKLLVTGLVPINGLFAGLARLNADGTPDPTFDPGSGPDGGVQSIVLQPDGKILIGGTFFNYDGTPRQQTARVNADGSLDAGFVPATPYTGFDQNVGALALQPDGKVLVGIRLFTFALRNRIFRLNADGSADDSFPQDGTGFEYSNSASMINVLLLQPDESLIVGGQFEFADDLARLALARLFTTVPTAPAATPTVAGAIATPTPQATPAAALDSFFIYKTKTTKGAAKFAPLGPLTLADAASSTDVDVKKLVALGLPVDMNDAGVGDAVTHLTDYGLKARKGGTKFRPIPDVRIQNACGDVVVTVAKPGDLLVPTLLNPVEPALPPAAATHEVADFRCYKVKVQKERGDGSALAPFPKGMQVDAADTVQSRRYDLKKLTRLCFPVAESGTPLLLKTGEPLLGFTPAALRHETTHLACYQAKPAKKRIAQNGCGAIDPKDKGTKIVPPPAKHQAQSGLRVISKLGPGTLDTAKELELCIPSTVGHEARAR